MRAMRGSVLKTLCMAVAISISPVFAFDFFGGWGDSEDETFWGREIEEVEVVGTNPSGEDPIWEEPGGNSDCTFCDNEDGDDEIIVTQNYPDGLGGAGPTEEAIRNNHVTTAKESAMDILAARGIGSSDTPIKDIGNCFELKPPGNFKARVIDGVIEVSDSFFASSPNEQIAIILHEYVHVLFDIPLKQDENGRIFTLSIEGTKEVDSETYAKLIEECQKMKEEIPNAGDLFMQLCIGEQFYEYTYIPSDYYQNEINAYQYCIDIMNQNDNIMYDRDLENSWLEHITNATQKRDEARDFEAKNGYNSQGYKIN